MSLEFGNLPEITFEKPVDGALQTEQVLVAPNGRRLTLYLYKPEYFGRRAAITRVSNAGESDERIPGATTALYLGARIAMEDHATAVDDPVLYMLSTKNPEMQGWAQDPTKGGKIFEWEPRPNPLNPNTGELKLTTLIVPRTRI